MSDACFHTEDVTCPNCALERDPDMSALAGLGPDFWRDAINGDDPTEAFMGRTIARQARTIRRLFTAYFLAKAKLKAAESPAHHNACELRKMVHGFNCEDAGVAKERARIVAALRAKVCANTSPYWDREATALGIVADAIERGVL